MGINRRGGTERPGDVKFHAANAVPFGWLECNGAAISRTAYAALFAAIGTTFGAGDGVDTFNIPDLRGEFIRGHDNGRGVDAGRVFGSAQADQMQQITGQFISRLNAGGMTTEGAFAKSSGVGGRTDASSAGSSTSGAVMKFDSADSPGARVGAETRGRNVAMLPCIKY